MRRAFFLLSVFAAACGKGNSPVTDQGNTLRPQSAVMFGASVFFVSLGGVFITDQPDACGTLASASSGNDACNSSGSAFDGADFDGTSLAMIFIPAGEGNFHVMAPDAGSQQSGDGGVTFNIPSGVSVIFSKVQNGQATFSDRAVSGTVNMDHFKIGDSASGSYDVVMQSGAHLTGTFDAKDCPALDAAIANQSSVEKVCSSSSSSSDACTGTCTCQGKTASANCSRPPDGGPWTCNCTTGSGQTSTCTMAASSESFEACDHDFGSCCPYTF